MNWMELRAQETGLQEELRLSKALYSTQKVKTAIKNTPEEIPKFLSNWKQLQENYDQFTLSRIAYFNSLGLNFNRARLEHMRVSAKFSESILAPLLSRFEELEKANEFYKGQLSKFGGDFDHERIETGKKIVGIARRLALEVNAALAGEKNSKTDPSPDLFKNGIKKWPVQKALIGTFLRALFCPNSGPGKTPNLDATFDMYNDFAKGEGITPVCNATNLPDFKRQDGKTITIVIHNHAHGIFDYTVMATRKRNGIGSIGNLDHLFGPRVADFLGRVNDIVLVGRDNEGTLNKLIRLCREKILSAWLVSSEAYTTAGFWDTRPLRKNLESIFLMPLNKAGIDVNIVVWTIPDTYRFLNLWNSPIDPFPREINLLIADPIENGDRIAFANLCGDRDAILFWVRQIWFENLKTNQDFFLSAPHLEKQKDIFTSYILGDRSANSYEEEFLKAID